MSTARPDLVAMRWRNPCLLARRRLWGWKGRFNLLPPREDLLRRKQGAADPVRLQGSHQVAHFAQDDHVVASAEQQPTAFSHSVGDQVCQATAGSCWRRLVPPSGPASGNTGLVQARRAKHNGTGNVQRTSSPLAARRQPKHSTFVCDGHTEPARLGTARWFGTSGKSALQPTGAGGPTVEFGPVDDNALARSPPTC